jgi:hypothetical protein
MTNPPEKITHVEPPPAGPLDEAREAAVSGRPELAQAWALIVIAEELGKIRRDLHWQRQQAGRRG